MGMVARASAELLHYTWRQAFDPTNLRWYFVGPDWDPFYNTTVWVAATTYAQGDIRKPQASPNGHVYVSETVSGDSGASEPTWPTDGSTVVDGDITWRDAGLLPPHEHRIIDVPAFTGDAHFGMVVADQWQPGTAYSPKDVVTSLTGLDGWSWVCTTGGTSGGSEPSWSYSNYTNDNGVAWYPIGHTPGWWALPDNATGSYTREDGVSASGVEINSATAFPALLSNQIAITWNTEWVGEYVKYAVLVSGTPGYNTDGVTTDEYYNPIVAVIDLDSEISGGALISESGGNMFVNFPSPTGVGQGRVFGFDMLK